jgi:hypothetical protein
VTTRKYAEGTSTPIDRSLAEIRTLLKRVGATGWTHGERTVNGRPADLIQFTIEGIPFRYTVEQPDPDGKEFMFTPTGKIRSREARLELHQAEVRRRWRELALLVKAKVVAIESGLRSVSQEFIADALAAPDATVAEYITPQLAAGYASGERQLPALPPA